MIKKTKKLEKQIALLETAESSCNIQTGKEDGDDASILVTKSNKIDNDNILNAPQPSDGEVDYLWMRAFKKKN
jgi:hypothetical protein